jgi:hypothetical protein
MVTLPRAIPVTIPVEEPTVAIEVLLLVHTPPGEVLDKVIAPPIQAPDEPVLAVSAATFTVAVAMHPEQRV